MNDATTLVIGIGNEWRGDDGVGPLIVKKLCAETLPHVRLVPNVADGLDLLDAWQNADCVYIIDALQSGRAPGTVVRVDALCETLPTSTTYSSHTFGLAEAIELSRTLNTLPKQLIVIGIEGVDFAMGAPITPAVEHAAQQLIAQLAAELRTLATGTAQTT
ncbi:MAG TPA: hydrogenase maturation protease [Spongiibacteraceae bacterium]|nr:hydrogenase maturation protease [Spongiibacteraceae bacterium]